MPPVFGPVSPSKAALWSCVAGNGTMARPPTRASRLNSGTVEPLFDDDPPAGRGPEFLADHDPLDRLEGVGRIVADDHALAGRQAVGLDDDGVFARFNVGPGRVGMVEHAELGRRHVGVPHQLLGKRPCSLRAGRPPSSGQRCGGPAA